MLRRLITTTAIAVAAILAPAAAASADDYGPDVPPCDISVEEPIIPVGEPDGYTVDCPEDMAGENVTVQVSFAGEAAASDRAVEVAGTSSEDSTLNVNGDVTDSATVSAPGPYTIQAFQGDEPITPVATFTAVAAADDGGGGPGLAVTGSTSLPYLVIAGGLLLVGATALVATRIRARRG